MKKNSKLNTYYVHYTNITCLEITSITFVFGGWGVGGGGGVGV
jgi:hypothetical protein